MTGKKGMEGIHRWTFLFELFFSFFLSEKKILFQEKNSLSHMCMYVAGKNCEILFSSYRWVSAWMASGHEECKEIVVEGIADCAFRSCSSSQRLCRSCPPCRSSRTSGCEEHPEPAGCRRDGPGLEKTGLLNLNRVLEGDDVLYDYVPHEYSGQVHLQSSTFVWL